MKIFKLFSVLFLLIFLFPTHAQWIPHVIDSNLPHATIIDTGDIDNDGDLDIAANGSPYVKWYRNNSPNNNWTVDTIDNTLDGAVGIAIVDIDGDGLLDIAASGYNSNQVRWYKNEGGNPISWHKYVVGNLDGAEFLRVDDIDGDGDPDIAVTGSLGNSVAWFENNMPDTIWDRHYIANGALNLATNVEIADIDGDGDLDIVATGHGASDVVWYKNDLPDTTWIETKIDNSLYGAWGICTGDIDGDSILDVVATGFYADKVNWYSTEDSGQTWTPHNIVESFYEARNVNVAYIDDDGDLDLAATAYNAGIVVWFENRLPGNSWLQHPIDTNLPTANYVCTADINEDGELDVLATGRESNLLKWYENIRKRIYPVNTNISKPYMIPSYDTLIITTKFSNFYQHNYTANAIYTNLGSSGIDSLILYDDGLHGDSLSNDGIWGAFIYPFADEDFFSIGISSLDLDNGQYFYKDDVVRFTTAGPVTLDSVTYMKGSADFYFIRPFVRNEGTTDTITNAKIRLLCNDPWVPPTNAVLTLPDLPPGETVGASGWFTQHYIDSLFHCKFNLKFESMVNGYSFWSDTIKLKVCIDWINEELQQPLVFNLEQNYPNPFNPTTTISWQSPVGSMLTLKVYDVLGREVATLVNKYKPAGKYEVEFDASNLSSGVYLYKIQIVNYTAVKKMLLLK